MQINVGLVYGAPKSIVHYYAYSTSIVFHHIPPVNGTNWYEETTGESSYSCNDRRQTESLDWKGTDESNKQSYPSLVETYVDNKDLQIHQNVVRLVVDQLYKWMQQ